MLNNRKPLTPDEIEIRIWAFVVVIVMLVFAGITASMLYSVIFVVQPIKSMAPIDQAFTKMLNDIVLLIVGGIGGIMSKRAVRAAAEAIGTTPPPTPTPLPTICPLPTPPTPSAMPNWNWMGITNPALDESWVPPPPPSTPPDYVAPEVEEISRERAQAKGEQP